MARQSLGIIIAACVLAAGCGGSSSNRKPTSSSVAAQGLAFSECVRTHGVPSFPDPGAPVSTSESSIGGIAIPASIDTQSPVFQTAFSSCRPLLSDIFSRQGKPGISATQKASMIAHAECLRTHGVPAYRDPTFPPGGGIETFDGPGVDPQSPAYQQAEADCGSR